MIEIARSSNADSRSGKNITKDSLKKATQSHIKDVENGMKFFSDMLIDASKKHDNTKLKYFNDFFISLDSKKVKDSNWYHKHITEERHHLIANVPNDVNLIDVFEHLVDCVMAGLSRSGEIYDINLSNEILQLAHKNTVELLKKNVKVHNKENDILDNEIV